MNNVFSCEYSEKEDIEQTFRSFFDEKEQKRRSFERP
jgi:hypothetical protein